MDNKKICWFLQDKGAAWIKWQRNTPAASYIGGAWEQQIRSTRSILLSLLRTHSRSLNNESFRSLMAEAEKLMNSRLLTAETLSDVTGY